MSRTTMMRLARTFEPEALRKDLQLIENVAANAAGFPGEGHLHWDSVPIYDAMAIQPKQPALDGMSYLPRVLESLRCPVYLARLMMLRPGGRIVRHRDPFLGFDSGLLRLHLPVVTHPDVELYIDGERCCWQAGELWYGDFSLDHWGHNPSSICRVHLVIDVPLCDATLELFPTTPTSFTSYPDLLSQAQGSPYEFAFLLPAGMSVAGMAPPTSATSGKIVFFGGVLFATIAGQPFLRLVPIDENRLTVIGLSIAAQLHLERRNNTIVAANLILDGFGITPLEVLESANSTPVR